MGFIKKEYSDGFFNVGKKNGFLPQQKPLETLPKRYSKLQEIAERVLHIKQLPDHRYIFPAGEEDLEQEWFDSNVARLKQILEDIPVKLTSANFSDGQKMVMLDRQHPNSIHLAIRDAVEQKGAGLYDFMIGLIGGPDDYL